MSDRHILQQRTRNLEASKVPHEIVEMDWNEAEARVLTFLDEKNIRNHDDWKRKYYGLERWAHVPWYMRLRRWLFGRSNTIHSGTITGRIKS